jgi:hypothetical protein
VSAEDTGWYDWAQAHPELADGQGKLVWAAAYRAGLRQGFQLSAQLGLGVAIQQQHEELDRMERLHRELESGSPLWRTRA